MDFDYSAFNPLVWGAWLVGWLAIWAIVSGYRKKHRFQDEDGHEVIHTYVSENVRRPK